jgi:phenylpropionate dioxygenase-like ring-hydroxylating dioxygenase large terminal subunit
MTDYNALVLPDRVSGRVYCDAEIFRDEMERIWHREWIYVAHASEVPEPGDFVTRRIGLQPVIVARGDDGAVHVLLNRCTHRGNTICQTERGHTRSFRCAYHGWTFNTQGALVGVPYAQGYGAEFRKEEWNLARVPRTGAHRGLIFASLSPTGPSLDEHLGPAKRLIDQFVDLAPEGEIVVRSGVLKHAYSGNWKMALENSVDGYHPNILHHAAISMMMRGKTDMESVFGEKSDALARDLGHGVAQLDLNAVHAKNGGRVVPPAWSKAADQEYRGALGQHHSAERVEQILTDGPPHFCLFPNLIFILNQMRVIQPVDVERTVVHYYPTLLKGAPAEINQRRLSETYLIHGPAGRVAPDDIEIYERNQIGFRAQVNDWLVLQRGLHREERDNAGVAGHETDETTQRGLWRHYREVMTRPN